MQNVQRANMQTQQQQALQTAVTSGAVVVQLSSNRAASYGESRQTDASFEKQQTKAQKEDKREAAESKTKSASVNVAA